MSSINQIGQIASGLIQYEFDYINPEDKPYEILVASGTISGKLGELNVLLNQSFSYTGNDGNPSPRLQQEETAILEQLYIQEYNSKQAQKILRNVYQDGTSSSSDGAAASDWVEIREGDTVIKRSATSSSSSASTKITLSKDFKALADDAARKIQQLVYSYNMYGSVPRQILFGDSCVFEPTTEEIERIVDIIKDIEYVKVEVFETEANIFKIKYLDNGTIAFGTDTHDFYVWDGAHWYTYANTVLHFKPDIMDIESNILSRTGDEASTIAYGIDTNNLYIWDGNYWYTYGHTVLHLKASLIDTQENIFKIKNAKPATIAFAEDTQDLYIWDGRAWYVYTNTVINYNISIADTAENIFKRTGDEFASIAYSTDTHDLYVWDGEFWYLYPNSAINYKARVIDTEESVLNRNEDEPATIAYATDTHNLYIWDGGSWYIYDNT